MSDLVAVSDEEGSKRAELIWLGSESVASVSLVAGEARAALAAAARGGRLTLAQHRAAKAELVPMIADLHLVEITAGLTTEAADLAETEALRGYDAVHLAAAIRVGASVPTSANTALCDAASRRGLHVANPLVARLASHELSGR